MQFKKIKLKDIADINMGQSPSGSSYNNNGRGIPFLQGNKTFGFLYPTIDTWTTEHKKIGKKNSVLMSVRAPVGDLNIANKDICIGRGLCSIEMKNGNNQYLYYLLKNSIKKIKMKSTGTVFESINRKELENIEILDFDKSQQKKISKILFDIDKKIELNIQTNDNLLELINNLYKESFSNIEEYKQADEIANITIGKTPPRSNRECFTYNEDDIKWLSISDLGKCGIYAWNTSEKLTENAVNKYNVKVIPENTIVLSFKLTIGRIAITANKMATNEAIAHFNLLDNDMIYYLYFYLKNFDYSKLGNTSSIATAVNSKIIKAMPIGIPNKHSVLEFNNTVRPLFEKIKLNEEQNMTLTQLSDNLLPKLMNGEIDLDKIEI